MKFIDLREGKFNLEILILFDYRRLFILLEKSKSFKRLNHIFLEQDGNFFVKEDNIDNFSEFIINLFMKLINNLSNSKKNILIKPACV